MKNAKKVKKKERNDENLLANWEYVMLFHVNYCKLSLKCNEKFVNGAGRTVITVRRRAIKPGQHDTGDKNFQGTHFFQCSGDSDLHKKKVSHP